MEEEEKTNNIIDKTKNDNHEPERIITEKKEEKNNINIINNNIEIYEIIENKISEEKNDSQNMNLQEEITQLNNLNLNKNDENNNNIINNNINIIEQKNEENTVFNDDISLINIDLEKEKNEKKNLEQKIEKNIYENFNENEEENINKINIENTQEKQEDEEKVDDYLFNDNDNNDNLKYNKEYTDDDNDLHSRRLTARNNEEYLQKVDDNNDIFGNNKIEEENDDEEQNEEENLFPFKTVGDASKKANTFNQYNYRYLELDAVKGVFKRFLSTKDYPKKPTEIIDIRNFKLIKKLKLIKEYYDLEITYVLEKKGKKYEKVESYRFRNQECRNKWFDSLLSIWKYLIKGTPAIKLNKNILAFVDDRLGIIQEIGRGKKNKNKKKKIDLKKFKIISQLGVGGFGTVFKVRHILTDKIYAMKVMNKNYIIQKKYLHYVVSEFEIMKSLAGFPFILDLHYCFQSANYLYLIIDYCPNGDFTKLESINNPKLFFAEVILAFEYIHKKNIIYRDLKPENILLDETGHIKICDFNLAKAGMTKHKRANSFCGSPLYFSPEMVEKKSVNYKCDIYGIGLLIYEIIVGHTAFTALEINELYEKIKKNQINFNEAELQGDAKDLIKKMCAKNPNDRIELEDVKKHRYFKDIDFNKVLKKEYGYIETRKRGKKKIVSQISINEDPVAKKKKEDLEYKKFLEQQKLLEEDEELTVNNGKITVKEMILDQSRHMKNKVREFYYVKEEDTEQTEEFKLEVNGNKDISSIIVEQYN